MSKGKFAAGAVFGALVGIAAGMLAAPKSGKETREDLKARAKEAKIRADAAIDDATVKGKQALNEARGQADTHIKNAKSTVDDYTDRVKRAAVSAKAELDRESNDGPKKASNR